MPSKNPTGDRVSYFVTGIIATKILEEAKKISERPNFWMNKHFHEYFKLGEKSKCKK